MAGFLAASGCAWPVRQRTDQMVCGIANQPFDLSPDSAAAIGKPSNQANATEKPSVIAPSVQKPAVVPAGSPAKRSEFRSTNELRSAAGPRNELRYMAAEKAAPSERPLDVHSAAWLEDQPEVSRRLSSQARLELHIPPRLPGAETPPVEMQPRDGLIRTQEIDRTYPALPPLPVEPPMLPGPDGHPYTLTDLQRIAAANSPALRQAILDVQRARGNLVQARTYQNPTGTYFVDPTNNNATTGVQGAGIEQVIMTGGKKKLEAASAQKEVENAQLALRRARNDLATQVRQAYFALLVDKETLAVTRAVARFTDEIYRLQTELVRGTVVADYEPTALRAQAFTTRLAYQQAIVTYQLDWKSLVVALGLRQLPLTQVAGRIDRFIPYYDYDQVLSYVIRNHTDILIARNQVPQARYNLKRAQVAIVPDLDVSYKFARDFTVAPFGTYQQFQIELPLALWDRNKGNIIAAQAALGRAAEQQHNAELDLTNRLADAYTNYQNNLYAIDYYRRYILPDWVRYYRGVYARRPFDTSVNVGDLAVAQQSLSQNVTAYLGVLGSMWQSVVAVADLLQTDDLFQIATPRPLPELPDFDELSRWACGHSHLAAKCGVGPSGAPIMQAPVRHGSPSSTSTRRGSPDLAPVERGSPDSAVRRPSVVASGSVGDRPEQKVDQPEQKSARNSDVDQPEPKKAPSTAQSVGAKRSGQ